VLGLGLLHLIYIVHINMYKQLLYSLTWTEITVGEYRKGNQKWKIQRHWQHRAQKTKTNKTKTQHNMCWPPNVIVRVIIPILYCIQ
jgi:hypothetical protein